MEYIRGKSVLTDEGWQRDLQIEIDDGGKIASIEKLPLGSRGEIDLILPAPVNLHSHSFQRAMAGLTEVRAKESGDNFWSWRELMHRFLRRLDPDQIEAIAALAFMEMLEAGYGSVTEFHYLHHDIGGQRYMNLAELSERIIAAASATGIGLTLLPVFYQYGGCDLRELKGGALRFYNDFDQFVHLYQKAGVAIAAANDDYNIGLAPHSLRAVAPEELQRLTALAQGLPIHIHVAEQTGEIDEILAHRNARPVEWLLDNHNVDPRWCLIHCTHMSERETAQLARTGAVAGLCPLTESNLGDGIFNAGSYLNHQGRLGVGSDSNIHISLFEELSCLEYSQRLRDRARALLATDKKSTGRNLFDLCLQGGAQASQRNCGAIKKGMWADLIGIDTQNQWIGNRTGDRSLDCLTFTGHGQNCITDLWSAGRHVIKQGRHIHRTAIIDKYIRVIDELGTDM